MSVRCRLSLSNRSVYRCPIQGAALDISLEQTAQVMDVNFMGTVRVVKAFVPRMVERRRGRVVAMGSISGEIGTPWVSIYNASKAALHEYMETLGLECRPFGVHVTLISAGAVRSNLINVSLFQIALYYPG